MDWSYQAFLIEHFAYRGFGELKGPSRAIVGYFLFFITLVIQAINQKDSIIKFLITVLIPLTVIPNILVYSYSSDIIAIPLLVIFQLIAISFFSKFFISFKAISLSDRTSRRVLMTFLLLGIVPFLITYGARINLGALLLKDIYEARDSAAESSNLYSRYFFSQISKILVPLVIIYGWMRKSKLMVGLGVVIGLYLYLINPHKSVLFSLMIVLAFAFLRSWKVRTNIVFIGSVVVLLVGRFLTEFNEDILFESLITRRVFFVPAILNLGYFEVFADTKIMLSNSILSGLIDYPYNIPPANLVASRFLGNSDIHSNNGIISTGFMNFGIIGAVGNIIFIALMISYIKALKLDGRLGGIVIVVIMTFLSSSLFTSLLTHGVFLFLMLSQFIFKNSANWK